MPSGPVVILVGGPSTGKTRFYKQFTSAVFPEHSTGQSTPRVAMYVTPTMVLVDTPGHSMFRNSYEYSWQGIFQFADVILDFGNWHEDQVFGTKPETLPKYMTWSGDNEETMKRLQEYLQGKK